MANITRIKIDSTLSIYLYISIGSCEKIDKVGNFVYLVYGKTQVKSWQSNRLAQLVRNLWKVQQS